MTDQNMGQIPQQPLDQQQFQPPVQPSEQKPKKKKIGVVIIGVVILLGLCGALSQCASGGSDSTTKTDTSAPSSDSSKNATVSKEDSAAKAEADAAAKAEADAAAAAKAEAAAAAQKIKDATFSAGTYIVGNTMPAGEYKVTATSGMGYIEVSRDSTGSLESIVANDNITTFTYITVVDGQYFKLQGCKAISVDIATPYSVTNGKYKDGTYKVGIDIPAGEYNIQCDAGATGYVEVSSDSTHLLNSIVTNDIVQGNTFQSVQNGQYLKLSGVYITVT